MELLGRLPKNADRNVQIPPPPLRFFFSEFDEHVRNEAIAIIGYSWTDNQRGVDRRQRLTLGNRRSATRVRTDAFG